MSLQDIRVHKKHSVLETGFNQEEQIPLLDDEDEGFNLNLAILIGFI